MLAESSKRSAPETPDSRPAKRQAPSSPEEGELDDRTPSPPPTGTRSPIPVKPGGNKVPFPFKKKAALQGERPEPLQDVGKPRGTYGRSMDDERRFKEDELRRGLPPRPSRYDGRPPPRGDSWAPSMYDSRPPRGRWDPPDPRYDDDRSYHPRGEPERDRWGSGQNYPPQSLVSPSPPRRLSRSLSRSRSRSRSRSPLSPESTGKEKHRLPKPSRLEAGEYENGRDSWGRGREDRYRRDRRNSSPRPPAWSGLNEEDRHYRPRDDAHDDWRHNDYDDDRRYDRRIDESYRPVSPRTPPKPLSPQSLRGPRNGFTSPVPPSDAPPPPPVDERPNILPTEHSAVKISLPKKPASPKRTLESLMNGTKIATAFSDASKSKPSNGSDKIDGETKPSVKRMKRQPVHRSREEEMEVFGKIFEGCGRQSDYEVMTKLGEGTFGEVHKARHKSKGDVALKRILMHNEKEGMPVTALREIKILKALHHPSIIEIVDMFVMQSKGKNSLLSVYMVFPYMDHDLAGLLENERVRLSPSQIKLYMKQLLEGTEYMHRNNILHRDMKAANLLISNTGYLKIADFGLARAYDPDIVRNSEGIDSQGRQKRERRYTNCVVTRWYRPPELLLGARQYGGEVDMWGIGCVLGEMFLRRPILPGSSDLDQLDKIWQLCGTPTQVSWPNYDTLPGCDGVKRFTMYPRRVKKAYEDIGPETVDLMDKLLTCNPRERISASQALDHDYFWTDPLPADPKSLPTYEASHEFDKRGRRNQAPINPPAPVHPQDVATRLLPVPTQPPPPHYGGRPPPPFHNGPPNHGPGQYGFGPGSGSGHGHRHHRGYPNHRFNNPMPMPPVPPPPMTLPPISLRPGQPPPTLPWGPIAPISGDMAHLPPRPPDFGRRNDGAHRGNQRHDGLGGSGGELNYG